MHDTLSGPALVSQILDAALKPIMPRGYISLPCEGCQSAVAVPENSQSPTFCSVCRRANAESVAHQALSDVSDLVRGCGIFAVLNADERREQLRGYGLHIEPDRNDADAPTAQERDEIESRIEAEYDEPVPDFDEGYSGGTF